MKPCVRTMLWSPGVLTVNSSVGRPAGRAGEHGDRASRSILGGWLALPSSLGSCLARGPGWRGQSSQEAWTRGIDHETHIDQGDRSGEAVTAWPGPNHNHDWTSADDLRRRDAGEHSGGDAFAEVVAVGCSGGCGRRVGRGGDGADHGSCVGWAERSDSGRRGRSFTARRGERFFSRAACLIGGAGAVYRGEYWTENAHPRSAPLGRVWWSMLLLCLGLVLVTTNGLHFLMAWELFTVAAYSLVTWIGGGARCGRRAGCISALRTRLRSACLPSSRCWRRGPEAGSLDPCLTARNSRPCSGSPWWPSV